MYNGERKGYVDGMDTANRNKKKLLPFCKERFTCRK